MRRREISITFRRDHDIYVQWDLFNLIRKLGIIDVHIGGNTDEYDLLFRRERIKYEYEL